MFLPSIRRCAQVSIRQPVTFPGTPTAAIEKLLGYVNEVMGTSLTIPLDWYREAIESQTLSFVRLGVLANCVRRDGLYKSEGFHSFKDWCERALKRTHWHIKRLIEAARVVLDLIRFGFTILPTCEAQCRPLVKYFDEDLIDRWQKVIELIPQHKIAANKIEEIVEELNPNPRKKRKSISVSEDLMERLAARAAEAEMSVEELLEELLADDNAVEQPDPEAVARWEEDLEELAQNEPAWEEDLEELAQNEPAPSPAEPLKFFDRFIEEMNALQASMGLCPPAKKKRGDSS